jgi:N-ethylmaleimide reductase
LYVGTAPCFEGRGYIRAPGIYSDAHVEGWKVVNDAIHGKGAFIFCQLMHAGRVSHSSLLPNNMLPVAPSAVNMEGLVHTPTGKVSNQ